MAKRRHLLGCQSPDRQCQRPDRQWQRANDERRENVTGGISLQSHLGPLHFGILYPILFFFFSIFIPFIKKKEQLSVSRSQSYVAFQIFWFYAVFSFLFFLFFAFSQRRLLNFGWLWKLERQFRELEMDYLRVNCASALASVL